MRLIDSDELLCDISEAEYHGGMGAVVASTLKRYISRTPTIDPESLRPSWIPVEERMPEAETNVLAFCKYGICKGGYVCCAYYEPKGALEEDSDFQWDYEALGDYNEEKDSWEIPEGWYERIHNWDDYGSVKIEDKVTHWMQLPEPPEVSK